MKKICILFGGASAEHDISIITGMQLAKNFSQKRDIEKIYLDISNRFYLASQVEDLKFFENKSNIKLKEIMFSNGAAYAKNFFLKKLFDIDIIINCCHGGVGENGDIASFFEVNKIKCTSANSLASHIAMDKSLCKQLIKDQVPTIAGLKITTQNYSEMVAKIQQEFPNEIIVKPNSLGSSIGVKCCNKENFAEQIKAIFELNDDALVEERVVDIAEYNQACFKTKEGLMLSAIEQPLTKSDFLTFSDKYKTATKTKGKDRIIPAKISPELEEQIIEYTSKIYKTLNMSGVVRIDYIYDKQREILYFNEINTIPGSMAFYLYEPIGVDYITLIEKLLQNADDIKKYTYIDTEILKDKKI